MMKKVLLGLIAAAAITSCIKREDSLSTDQATNLGKGTITGAIWAKTDYIGDTLPNGATDFDELGVTGLQGFNVTATYSTNNLDPDNVNAETMVMNTTTDANGEYTFSVDATGQGTTVTVQIDGIVTIDVTHEDPARAKTDTNTVSGFAKTTESLRFNADDLNTPSYTVTVRSGQTESRATEVLETEQL